MRKLHRIFQDINFQETIIWTVVKKKAQLSCLILLKRILALIAKNLVKYSELEKHQLNDEENIRNEFEMFEDKHFIWNLIN